MTIKVERPDPISAPLKLGHVQQNAYVVKVASDMSTDGKPVTNIARLELVLRG